MSRRNHHTDLTALQERIFNVIQGMEADSLLPKESELAFHLGVGKGIVRKALDAMIADARLTVNSDGSFVVRTAGQSTLCSIGVAVNSDDLRYSFPGILFHLFQQIIAARGAHCCQLVFQGLKIDDPGLLNSIDGLILLHRITPDMIPDQIPVVVVMQHQYMLAHATYLMLDDYLAGTTAARYLISRGHQRLAFVSNYAAPYLAPWEEKRCHGVCEVMRQRGLGTPVCLKPENDRTFSHESLQPLIDQQITGVICGNDDTAISVIACLKLMGIKVPENISVIGFDDIPQAKSSTPPLTTIGVPMVDLATTAVDHVLQRIHNPAQNIGTRIIIPMELVERGSCREVPRVDSLTGRGVIDDCG